MSFIEKSKKEGLDPIADEKAEEAKKTALAAVDDKILLAKNLHQKEIIDIKAKYDEEERTLKEDSFISNKDRSGKMKIMHMRRRSDLLNSKKNLQSSLDTYIRLTVK